jgi:hypothetical protein
VTNDFSGFLPAIPNYVNGAKDPTSYPWLLMWSWMDEAAASASVFRGWTDAVRALDTNHPVWENLAGYGWWLETKPTDAYHALGYLYDDLSIGSKKPIADVIGFDQYNFTYRYDTRAAGDFVTMETFLSTLDNLVDWNYNLIVPGVFVSIEREFDAQGPTNSYIKVKNVSGNFLVSGASETICDQHSHCVALGSIPAGDYPIYNITSASFIKLNYDNSDSYCGTNNSPCSLFVLAAASTFTAGDTLTGQTSNAAATYIGIDTTRPCGFFHTFDSGDGPTGAELRNQIYLSLIHGAKIIQYFNYFCTDPPDRKADILSTLNQFQTDTTSYKDWILGGVSSKVTTSHLGGWAAATMAGTGRVDYTIRELAGVTYLMAARVKKATGDQSGSDTATLTVAGLPSSTVVAVLGESRNVTSGNGTISDSFADNGVHSYQIGAPIYGTAALTGGGSMRLSGAGSVMLH